MHLNLPRRRLALALLIVAVAVLGALLPKAPAAAPAPTPPPHDAHHQVGTLQRETRDLGVAVHELGRAMHKLKLEVKRLKASVRYLRRTKRAWVEWGKNWRKVARHGVGSRAARVVHIAKQQLGKPYVFGTAGPRTFDCSGLVKYAYGKVGIRLAHSATAQQHASRKIPLSALRAGDLVFYGNAWRSYHVGIYIGGGRTVEATDGHVQYGWVGWAWTGGTFFH